MVQLLKNIQCLRMDIDRLTVQNNDLAYEYCELAIKIADNKEYISIISSEKKCIENYIKNFKYKKSLLYSFPIGIIFSVPYFMYQIICNLDRLTFRYSILQIVCSGTIVTTVSVAAACFFIYSNKFKNFLVKKYPSFKYMNYKLNNLIIEIKSKEKELTNIEKKKEDITNIILNNEEILESKKERLRELECDYFNNIKNNSAKRRNTYNISAAGKKLTLTRGNN